MQELISLPSKRIRLGNLHPITKILEQISDTLRLLGYQQIECAEIESKEYNFDRLGIALDHPARESQDTFYLNEELLLRTHTSNSQIRVLEKHPNKPLRFYSFGKVYRRDVSDCTHTHQFTQLEGVAVGKDISFANLKATLQFLLERIFGKHPLRFRPAYFAFTRPSIEIDAQCIRCTKGCSICKNTGWVEVLGAGLIHPQILVNCNYDSQTFTGFAFGIGIERLLMIKYGLEDVRHLYRNDLRFLRQF